MSREDSSAVNNYRENQYFPSGRTRLYPVVGDPIGQARSPAMMTRLFAAHGDDAIVVPMHVKSADLPPLFGALHGVRNLGGILVTVPHKRMAAELCAGATDRARFVGSVNVVRRQDAGWYGDNTDGVGYLDGAAREGFDVAGKRALLVGCGGAGAAIALEILLRGVAQLAIHDLDAARRDEILAKLAHRFPGKVLIGDADPSGFDLIANATPMGMHEGDPPPVDLVKLHPEQFVACVVTEPAVTPLIAAARARGCRTMTGAGMFDAQAGTLADFLRCDADNANVVKPVRAD